MLYLQPALFAEGPTDHRFLKPLLLRVCTDICCRAQSPVDVADVIELHTLSSDKGLSRAQRVFNAAVVARDAWNVLFLHADADSSDAISARADRVNPAFEALERHLPARHAFVAVVPIRATDAWMLADGEAIKKVFGLSDSAIRDFVPQAAASVQRVSDPKRTLSDLFNASLPSPGRRRSGVGPYLGLLGEEISLERLQRVPSFGAMLDELTIALTRLRITRP